jgi:hypothetical protein
MAFANVSDVKADVASSEGSHFPPIQLLHDSILQGLTVRCQGL